jgi:hypothetical protein
MKIISRKICLYIFLITIFYLGFGRYCVCYATKFNLIQISYDTIQDECICKRTCFRTKWDKANTNEKGDLLLNYRKKCRDNYNYLYSMSPIFFHVMNTYKQTNDTSLVKIIEYNFLWGFDLNEDAVLESGIPISLQSNLAKNKKYQIRFYKILSMMTGITFSPSGKFQFRIYFDMQQKNISKLIKVGKYIPVDSTTLVKNILLYIKQGHIKGYKYPEEYLIKYKDDFEKHDSFIKKEIMKTINLNNIKEVAEKLNKDQIVRLYFAFVCTGIEKVITKSRGVNQNLLKICGALYIKK